MSRAFRLAAGLVLALLLGMGAARAIETHRFPAPGAEAVSLNLHAATDVAAMRPLIEDFQATRPDVGITYTEYVTAELFDRMRVACEGAGGVDLVLSSSVDQLVKLVNDGCAEKLGLASTGLPRWTRWRDELFGFTFEPAVIVYNRDAVRPEDVRRTRAELIDLLRADPERYAGRIGTYDVTSSGIGYLFSAYDARAGAVFGRVMEALGRARVSLSCCTTDILDALSAGRLAIGYNLLGSYAVAAVRAGAPLRVVIPRDYTLVLSRAIFVPKRAPHTEAARAFVAYLLSARGQARARETSFAFGFDGNTVPEADGPALPPASAILRPIEISPELLAIQDRAKRARLLGDWRSAVGAPVEAGAR
ncbi:ABC transporter substrate-binding protein [Methylobacterium symbioticum]|uniref:ABC transporter substrate-binding protein n=1 Tax=Methylobacterium symbioticum TaxID=2584084 RepID=A0A509EFY9_9HYPH|nr:ABC transporter substrate-binding protein [Methylobacterium symbioticum]VUD72554.1 hypothetical protein MET9862_03154 [Methylobacterium symbioticum]